MDIFFSIIIPTYNRGHLIRNTILSVLEQRYTHYELIVIDDGSTDDTRTVVSSIIAENPDKKITYAHQPNSERAVARNNGLARSAGDYIIYFDSDDTLYPDHLDVAANYIRANGNPEFLHLRYDIKNEKHQRTGEGPQFHSPPNKKLIAGNFLSCNGVVLRRDIALQNRFNEDRDLSALEDWELWLRIAARYPLHYINTITSSVINHENRSVLAVNKEKLLLRTERLMHYVLTNDELLNYYRGGIRNFKLSCYSYVSLHLALTGQFRKDAAQYLLKSLQASPAFIFKKRFFAILKHLI